LGQFVCVKKRNLLHWLAIKHTKSTNIGVSRGKTFKVHDRTFTWKSMLQDKDTFVRNHHRLLWPKYFEPGREQGKLAEMEIHIAKSAKKTNKKSASSLLETLKDNFN